jgi:hypothetical protein
MTVVLVVLGGIAAALGTRIGALAFAAAAAIGARNPAPVVASISTWTCVLLAGWTLLDRRATVRLAVPAFGAAAVIAAAAAPNGAVVFGLWTLGSAAAITTRPPGARGNRWAVARSVSDLVLAAAIAVTAPRGFQGWPFTLPIAAVYAVLASATIRMSLAAGSDDDSAMTSLVIVRTQSVLLFAYAVAASPSGAVRTVLVVSAVAFAGATMATRTAVVDVAQEVAIAAMAMATTRLGWTPGGWIWGALAAGTLMHHLRFSSSSHRAGAFGAAIRCSAGIGLPFLPVAVAQLEGAVRVRDWSSAVVLLGLTAGFAGRWRVAHRTDGARQDGSDVRAGAAWIPIAATLASASWAPFLSLPRPPGGAAVAWPNPWALVIVALAAIVGALSAPIPITRSVDEMGVLDRTGARVYDALGSFDRVSSERLVWTLLALECAAAVALWVSGLARGFL